MRFSNRRPAVSALASALCLAGLTAGCSSLGDGLSGDKVDYRQSGAKVVKLDVPPDLSQLPGQVRYGQVGASTVTASSLGNNNSVNDNSADVALTQAGSYKLMRDGQMRWLSVALPPDKVWPAVQEFWKNQGVELVEDDAQAGVLTTAFVENRAKVPQDGVVRKTLGRAFDMLYDSGERDQYRLRVERTATGSEIYIAHRGLIEEYEDRQKDRTIWRGRPSDPQLEAAILSKLMVQLGLPKKDAEAVMSKETAPAVAMSSYARLNDDKASLTLDTDLDTAWRRVGLALDRGGFTVESRDRKQGAYEIRLSASDVEANRPGFFARLFGAKPIGDGLSRFRVTVQTAGKATQVQVLSDTGKVVADNPMAQRVAKQLLDELS
ncbi:MAG: hypothetical protein RI907_224 [Pseudomonadota bacterium]